ncbi:MAG: class I SAM-dependent methyltransferase [Nitrospiraceae bacterium]|nr:class I SAM-dependent methyltransferase [Nitrospiraceae bacterium]
MEPREYERMYACEDGHWWYAGTHDLVLRQLSRSPRKPLRIFDAGCGTGGLLQLLSPFGEAQGCDVSEEALALCARRGVRKVMQADLNTVRLAPGSYDVITCIDVLYHRRVRDDRQVLARFFDALAPGGMLILQAPAYEWLRSGHDVAVHTARRYRKKELLAKARECGFAVEFATYRVSMLFPLIAGLRLLRRFFPGRSDRPPDSDVTMPTPMLNTVLRWILQAENRLLDRISLPFGSSLFIRARKASRRQVKREACPD